MKSVIETVEKRHNIIFAWIVILLVSDLPNVIWNGFDLKVPVWLFWAKVGVLAIFFMLCLTWKIIRPLRQFALVMFVFYSVFLVSNWVGKTSWWQSHFNYKNISFTLAYLGAYILDIAVSLSVIIVLWIIKRDRKDFFLTMGNLKAPFERVRWLGIPDGKSWGTFGWIFALIISGVTLIVMAMSMRISSEILLKALLLLPAVLIFAAINAFNEEMYFRASLLSTLHSIIGRTHVLLITAIFFGLAHYLYGTPSGIIGFLMTGFLGWLLGKSILETKGFFWAWFIHFLADVVIFIGYAIAWVQK